MKLEESRFSQSLLMTVLLNITLFLANKVNPYNINTEIN